jgi:hypothetical protein
VIYFKKALMVWLCLGALVFQSQGQTLPKPMPNTGSQTPALGKPAGEFTHHAALPPPVRSMKIGLVVVGTLSLLGLGAIGVGGFVRHNYGADIHSFRFPTVDRPERLGAPCGGIVTARRFAKPGPRATT